MRIVVMVNECGSRIGQDHPGAKLTDHEVELMRKLYEQGMGYKRLAQRFEASIRTVRGIVQYKRRAQTCGGFKTIEVGSDEGTAA